jgi:hypothetical protein
VMSRQEKLVRWLVRELNAHDNLIFELQNEPWSDNHTMSEAINPYLRGELKFPNVIELTTPDALAWQRSITQIITDEERHLPQKHLIAQNVANFRIPVSTDDISPEISIINFHYAYPEAVTWNEGLGRAIGYDESGFAGSADQTYRRQAWNFIMSGGGLFNNLDYCFHVGAEDGNSIGNKAPGGGSPALRRQLKTLSDFLHHFELSGLNPDHQVVKASPGAVARVLSAPGQHYLIYLEGRGSHTLNLHLAPDLWHVEWLNVESGEYSSRSTVTANRGPTPVTSPSFNGEIAARIFR